MAGRSLGRALKKLHSASLESMSSEIIRAGNASRPGSPGPESPMSSATLEQLKAIENAHADPMSDNGFLRTFVEQSMKEKAMILTVVENLHVESKSKSLDIKCIFVIGAPLGRRHA
jgi:hypothetical protein